MKHFLLLFLGVLMAGLTGCDSVGMKVRDRFAPPVYHAKVVGVDQRQAYAAAFKALDDIGFKFVRGGPAQGRLEALGPVMAPDGRGTARQRSLIVKFSSSLEGGTEISILFSELVEEDFNKRPGEGVISPLSDSPLYEEYFRRIDSALAAGR